jgi:hypothetical protein
MQDDIFQELAQFQRQAEGLRRLIDDAQTRAPESSVGEDESGTVRVTLSHDGLPETIRVDGEWRRRMVPVALAGAVQEGAQAAANARLAAWSRTLEAGNWQAEAESIMRQDASPPAWTTPVSRVPAMFRAVPPRAPSRSLGELAEEMMASLGRADEIAASSPAVVEVVGEGAGGKVGLTLSRNGGLVRCAIDTRWAGEASAGDLNRALEQALGAARAKLGALGDDAGPAARLDSLFDEAMSFLQDPNRSAD